MGADGLNENAEALDVMLLRKRTPAHKQSDDLPKTHGREKCLQAELPDELHDTDSSVLFLGLKQFRQFRNSASSASRIHLMLALAEANWKVLKLPCAPFT